MLLHIEFWIEQGLRGVQRAQRDGRTDVRTDGQNNPRWCQFAPKKATFIKGNLV